MVFLSGLIFFILTLLKVREMILNAVPPVLKLSTAAGIGLFIAFIGFKDAGMVVSHPATFVALGDVGSPPVLLAIFGIILTSGLMARKIKGAIIIGIIATATLGIATGLIEFQTAAHVSIKPTLGKFDLKDLFQVAYIVPIVTLLFFDLFDTIGTLIGVSERAGFLDEEGNLPRASRALSADAVATMAGAVLGTSTTTSYIESAAGIAEGGRTGFANVITAAMFLLAILIAPLAQTFGGGYKIAENVYLYPVTAPALIVVGFLMMSAVKKIDWSDYAEALPAFFTILAMPLTFSISNGLALGFITYSLIMVMAGRAREVHPLNYALAVLFLARYIFL
jgi:AGZA family xanthine/uracil permease-like MFS transporter